MQGGNHWGGSFEVTNDNHDDEKSRNMEQWDKASLQHSSLSQRYNHLDETQQSWLLGPPEAKKKKYVDLGCVVLSRKAVKWIGWSFLIAFIVIALPIIIVKVVPKHKPKPPPPDDYSLALHKALLFFNAQKCKYPSPSWKTIIYAND